MTVGIVTAIYGGHWKYLGGWKDAVDALDGDVHEIVLAYGDVSEMEYPLPTLLNATIVQMTSDWIWRIDVDDRVLVGGMPDLGVGADVKVVPYITDEGVYVPPPLSNEEYLAGRNTIPGCSPFRRDKFLEVGGYPEIGYEDWGLWRKMARAGAKFSYTSVPATHYAPGARTLTEFPDLRKDYYEELIRECP